MEQVTVNQLAERISELLGERLGAKGKTLRARIGSAGSQLPRKVRKAALELVEAQEQAMDAGRALELDAQKVTGDYSTCLEFLKGIEPGEIRVKSRLRTTTLIVIQLTLIVLALSAFLGWRGY
ncbi:MAG: hypothetical protein HKP40_08860 [Litoreibacter sp.]|nr:hypothetical protein [Litoreibacter sp.]